MLAFIVHSARVSVDLVAVEDKAKWSWKEMETCMLMKHIMHKSQTCSGADPDFQKGGFHSQWSIVIASSVFMI